MNAQQKIDYYHVIRQALERRYPLEEWRNTFTPEVLASIRTPVTDTEIDAIIENWIEANFTTNLPTLLRRFSFENNFNDNKGEVTATGGDGFTFIDGKEGKAIKSDGSHTLDFGLDRNLFKAMAFWTYLKADDVGESKGASFGNGDMERRFRVQTYYISDGGNDNKVNVRIDWRTGSTSGEYMYQHFSLPVTTLEDKWYFIVINFTPTGQNDEVYIDGQKITTTTTANNASKEWTGTAHFGAYTWDNETWTPTVGVIDELEFHSDNLTADGVNAIYHNIAPTVGNDTSYTPATDEPVTQDEVNTTIGA